jgi:hypothetical protein
MERNGHEQRSLCEGVASGENRLDALERTGQQLPEPVAKTLAMFELQLENRCAQVAGVEAVAAREIELIFAVSTTAANAGVRWRCDVLMGGQLRSEGYAATFATRPCPKLNVLPAAWAYINPT